LVEDLFAIDVARCPSPLSREEVEKIAESISRYEPCRKSKGPPPPKVIGMLGDKLEVWWETDWSGQGGPSERDVELILIILGLKFGQIMPEEAAVKGVNVSVSYSQLAEMMRVGKGTAHRAVKRLKAKGRVRSGGNGPNRWQDAAAGIVLLAPASPRKVEHSSTTAASSTGGVGSVPPCALPPAPRGRHSAPGLKRMATKRHIAVVDHLERAGGWLDEEDLASELGIKRARDVRRRYLEPLAKEGVVESSGREWRLTEDWHLKLEEVFENERDLERALYSGKTADERQKERHQKEREAYRRREEVVPESAPTREELRKRRESAPEHRRRAVEQGLILLFHERPEYRYRRVGQIACALVSGAYLLDDFPKGVDPGGLPKDQEVAAILEANGIEAA